MQAPWIFSCNTKMFDIDKHFAENSTVVWKSRGAKKDDIVCIDAMLLKIIFRTMRWLIISMQLQINTLCLVQDM